MKVGMRMGVVCSVVAFGCVDPADPMDPMDPMDPGSVTCGEGTVLVDGMCVGLSCGPGTHREGNACVRDDGTRYELRVYSTEIPANGYSKSPVLVIARALEKDPARRHPDPEAFAGELRRCVPDAAELDECLSDRIAAWLHVAPSTRSAWERWRALRAARGRRTRSQTEPG